MKKIFLIVILVVAAFALEHGQTNDPDLKLALEGKYTQAFQGFEKRCAHNNGYACGMVGYFYAKGFGVKKNQQKAIQFYKKGCQLNDSDSCTLLGYYYYKKGDIKQAKTLLNKACKLGNNDACNYLGGLK